VKRFATLRIIDTAVTMSATALADETKLILKAVTVPAWFLKPASPSHSREFRSNQQQL